MLFRSGLVTDASGSLGGITASRNQSGLYLRSRVVPVNPNSPAQNLMRSIIAILTSAWTNELTQSERDGWETYAEQVPLIGRFGIGRVVSGQNQYVRSNAPRLMMADATITRVDIPPLTFDKSGLTQPSLTLVADGTMQVTFNTDDEWVPLDGSALYLLAGRATNPSRTFYGSPYRFTGTIVKGDSTTPPVPPVEMGPYPFGVLQSGQRVFALIAASLGDGRLTSPRQVTAIVP